MKGILNFFKNNSDLLGTLTKFHIFNLGYWLCKKKKKFVLSNTVLLMFLMYFGEG